MTSELQILTTRNFNGIQFDCYKAENEDDGFWATREQIGQVLGYANPRISIANIHNRNKERFDKFSDVINLITPDGGTQATTVYNFKGFLEICRFSNQPKANAVIDFAWNIMDEIRRTGSYNAKNSELDALNIRAAEVLQRIAQLTSSKEEKNIVLNEAFKLVTGYEMPKKVKVNKEKYCTASDIAKILNWLPEAVMTRAENLGITRKAVNGYWNGDIWYFSNEGRKKFLELVDEKIIKIDDEKIAYYEDGRRRIYWSFDI